MKIIRNMRNMMVKRKQCALFYMDPSGVTRKYKYKYHYEVFGENDMKNSTWSRVVYRYEGC